MSPESLGLQRKIRTESSNLFEMCKDWPGCLQSYKCDAVARTWSNEFAKTHAIQELYQGIQNHGAIPKPADLLKALITGRGFSFRKLVKDHTMYIILCD